MPTVAAIDVGSNATRFATLTVSECGVAEPLQLQRYAIRLGADVFAHGVLGPDIRATLKGACQDMQDAMAARGVTAYRAVATSAMRDAHNGADVVRELAAATGLTLEIISGEEESRLSRDALVRAMGTVPGDGVIVDLGGGSLEIDRPKSRKGRSLPLGTVRLLQRFPELRVPVGPAMLTEVRAKLHKDLRRGWPKAPKTPLAVGTGGNLELLAHLVGEPEAAVPRIRLKALWSFCTTVAAMQLQARIEAYGLRPDRADLVVPAALVILALHDWLGLEILAVPKTGLRDALLHEQIAKLSAAQPVPTLVRGLEGGKIWQRQARRTADWLAFWFDKLSPVHGLFPPALGPLQAAHAAMVQARAAAPRDPPAGWAQNAAALLHSTAATHARSGTPDLGPEGLRLAWETLAAYAGLKAPSGRPDGVLAALLHLAEACSQAHRGAPQGAVDLLAEPFVITTPQALTVSVVARATWQQAFPRPLVLHTRSH